MKHNHDITGSKKHKSNQHKESNRHEKGENFQRIRKNLELLAPGGSFDSVKAAFMAGADAVYMGGDRFSARAYAESAEEHSLEKAIDYAHLHDKRLYLTLNTLLKEREAEQELYDFVAPLYERGLDGILVQDLGVLGLVRREFPELPVHASTQMTVTDAAGALALKSLGVTRVVASRELNLEELKAIYDATGMELEAFVHGAICYCYSGRCLYSSLIGNRSGNRGRCAQPCRLPYELKAGDGKRLNDKQESYLLSLKDMCTLEYLPQMADAGVMSFKIEGRMKSPLYTAGIVSIYRKYLDLYLRKGGNHWQIDPADLNAVSEFFDRGGFTQYLTRHNGREMMALREKPKLRKPDPVLMENTEKLYLNQELKESIKGFVHISEGEPAYVTLSKNQVSVTVCSEERVQHSQNRPLVENDIKKQMKKLGNTPFAMEALEVELSKEAFMPVKQLNELRRKACEKLEEEILFQYRRKQNQVLPERVLKVSAASDLLENDTYAPQLHVSLGDASLLETVLENPDPDILEFDFSQVSSEKIPEIIESIHRAGKKVLIKLPEIYRGKAIEDLKRFTGTLADGMTAANLDELYALSELHYERPVVLGHSVYLWNREAKEELKLLAEKLQLQIYEGTAPYELHARELNELGIRDMRLFVYGHMPMMVTANCLKKTAGVCVKERSRNTVKEPFFLLDRKNAAMPVVSCCRYCYNTIYNAVPVFLLDQEERIRELKPAALYVSFTQEQKEQAAEILTAAGALKNILMGNSGENPNSLVPQAFTRGHFTRGVL